MATAKVKADEAAAEYRVAAGTQVHYDGRTYEPGQTVPFVPEDDQKLIAYQVNAGWIEQKGSSA